MAAAGAAGAGAEAGPQLRSGSCHFDRASNDEFSIEF